ncbi:MAG: endolytic transglycosylase MltG [Bdellovibrionota bacterium]
MKSLAKLFLFLVVASAGVGIWLSYHIPEWALSERTLSAPVIVKLSKGEKVQDFAYKLESQGVIDSIWRFRIWIRFFKDYSRFQAGQYKFEGQVSPVSVVDTIQNGKTFEPFELQFVIPEGFTLKQVIDRLEARKVASRAVLTAISQDPELLKKYRITGPNVEGFLYPATYSFEKMPDAVQVFEKMLYTFFQNLPQGIEERFTAVGLDLRKAVIFASLIEKEATHEDEMPMISEVIWNRLNAGQALGIDAALIYGIQDYAGDIKTVHLKDAANPYNSRIHRGLPPGPIGAISMQALQAVLAPTKLGYWFYVLKNDGSSYHNFSRTLAEHNRFVKELIRAPQKP